MSYETSAERYLNTFLKMLSPTFFNSTSFRKQLNTLGAAVIKTNHALHCHSKLTFGATRFVIIGSTFVIKIDKKIDGYFTTKYGNNRSEFDFFQKHSAVLPLCPCQVIQKKEFLFLIMPKCKKIGQVESGDILDLDELHSTYGLFDIHNENVGLLNKRPVIIDYAANREER